MKKENIKQFIIQQIQKVMMNINPLQQKVKILEEFKMNKENKKEN